MSKIITNRYSLENLRWETKHTILNKYYNYFLNNWHFKELNYQQNDYIFRRYWSDGKIACFKIPHMESEGYDALCFTPFASLEFNNYNFPTKINLINTRGVKFIPSKIMIVDKDAVIGWAQKNLKPIAFIVDWYVERITTYEMLMRIQEIVNKMPFLISATEENKDRIRAFMDKLIGEDNPVIFCNMAESNLFKALVSGAPYIIDKLNQQKQYYENELLTYLGIDNLGGSEKKEHLITSEVESNDMLIKESADIFADNIQAFADRIEKVFGFHLTLECKSETYKQFIAEEENEEMIETDEEESNNDNERN